MRAGGEQSRWTSSSQMQPQSERGTIVFPRESFVVHFETTYSRHVFGNLGCRPRSVRNAFSLSVILRSVTEKFSRRVVLEEHFHPLVLST